MSRKKWVLVILFGVIMVANIYMLWTRCVPISDVMAASIPAVFSGGGLLMILKVDCKIKLDT